jgi:hypothetical protein
MQGNSRNRHLFGKIPLLVQETDKERLITEGDLRVEKYVATKPEYRRVEVPVSDAPTQKQDHLRPTVNVSN